MSYSIHRPAAQLGNLGPLLGGQTSEAPWLPRLPHLAAVKFPFQEPAFSSLSDILELGGAGRARTTPWGLGGQRRLEERPADWQKRHRAQVRGALPRHSALPALLLRELPQPLHPRASSGTASSPPRSPPAALASSGRGRPGAGTGVPAATARSREERAELPAASPASPGREAGAAPGWALPARSRAKAAPSAGSRAADYRASTVVRHSLTRRPGRLQSWG